jgi:hypothetical protein
MLFGFLFGLHFPRTTFVLLFLFCYFGFYLFAGGGLYWLITQGFGSFLLHALPGSRLFLG